ncbi:hypothetical protein HAV15_005759 [Penicillium sp. str. |nr:hypothetical protein HAV15_005759 [Penicillium sp. str. \
MDSHAASRDNSLRSKSYQQLARRNPTSASTPVFLLILQTARPAKRWLPTNGHLCPGKGECPCSIVLLHPPANLGDDHCAPDLEYRCLRSDILVKAAAEERAGGRHLHSFLGRAVDGNWSPGHVRVRRPVSNLQRTGRRTPHAGWLRRKAVRGGIYPSSSPIPASSPPVPMDTSAAETAESTDAQIDNEYQTFSTVLTIREARHADGRKTYEAHTGPFVRNGEMEDPSDMRDEISIEAPSDSNAGMTYMERLRNNRTMHAISTMRRRKAKMKKHKFKKLMKRTRTLRRKLDK